MIQIDEIELIKLKKISGTGGGASVILRRVTRLEQI